MSETFDPYYKWLGIPPKDQPANYYRLLGLTLFEQDAQVIESAADRQMSHLRTYQSGRYSAQSQQLLNEVSAARVCLLNADKKSAYEAELRAKQAPVSPPVPVLPLPTAAPQLQLPVAEVLPVVRVLPVAQPVIERQPTIAVRPQPSQFPTADRHVKPAPRQTNSSRLPAIISISITAVVLVATAIYVVSNRLPQSDFPGSSPNSSAPIAQSPEPATSPALERASPRPTPAPENPKVGDRKTPVVEQDKVPPRVVVTPPAAAAELASVSPSAVATPAEIPAAAVPQTAAALPTGEPVDLLKLIDLSRDTIRGKWTLTNSEGLSTRDGLLRLPFHDVHRPYRLEITGRPYIGNGSMNVGLFHKGKQFKVVVDWNDQSFLSQVDGQYQVADAKWRQPVFKDDADVTVAFNVLDEKLVMTADGRQVFEWRQLERLSANPSWVDPTNPQALTLGWNLAGYRVSKLEATPLATGSLASASIDLLKSIDLTRDTMEGAWTLAPNKLTAPRQMSLLQLPYRGGNDPYELEIVARRIDGTGGMNIGLVHSQTAFLLVIDQSGRSYLSFVDGRHDLPQVSWRRPVFSQAKDAKVVIQVTDAQLTVSVDDQPLLEWREFGRLSPNNGWHGRDKTALAIGWNLASFEISKLAVTPFVGGAVPATPGPTPTVAAVSRRGEPARRSPVPAEADLQAAETKFRDTFQKQLAQATKPADKLALAKMLAEDARKLADDLPDCYVVLGHARDLAVDSGDIPLSLEVMQSISRTFEGNLLPQWTDTVSRLSQNHRTSDARPQLVEQTLQTVGLAVAAGTVDEAVKLTALALSVASKTSDTELKNLARDRHEAIKELQSQYVAARQDAGDAPPSADDAPTCLVRGKYLCFVLQDWDAGLPLLATGSSDALKALIERERTPAKSPPTMAEIADAWYERATSAPEFEKKAQQARAQHWYQQCVGALAGLEKVRIEKRLAALVKLDLAAPAASSKSNAAVAGIPDEGTGFIGRLSASGTEAGLLVRYPVGTVIREQAIRDLLDKHRLLGKAFRLELAGVISLTQDNWLTLTPSGSPGKGGKSQVFIDGTEVRFSATSADTQVSMKKGSHAIQWVLTGTSLVDCRLDVNDFNRQVTVVYTKDLSGRARRPKPKAEIDLSTP